MFRLAPPGVGVHFTRMVARGITGSHDGQEERNLSQIAHLDENVEMLALVQPAVIVLAHTATSYTLGRQAEAELVERMHRSTGIPFITAFGSVLQALAELGARRIALATPYSEHWTERGRRHLQDHGVQVVSSGRLENVRNIYLETPERAAELVRRVDSPQAQAVFISGVGMPTIDVLQSLEDEIGKPVLSSASAMMWNALRIAKVRNFVLGFGTLLSKERKP
jgi:maleate isomerase